MPLPWGQLWRLREMLTEVRSAGDALSLREARLFAAQQLTERRQVTGLSQERLTSFWARFERFAGVHGVRLIGDVTPGLTERFVRSLTQSQRPPSTATMHLRRASIRLLFKVLREFGVVDVDPTVDVALPSRSGVAVRPLTDDEVDACRWAALSTVDATRHPAIWALGEAGASTREIAKVTAADIDVDTGQLWLGGGPRTNPRLVPMTEWGSAQMRRRIRELRQRASTVLAFDRPLEEDAGRISAAATLTAVMARAGLGGDKAVRPRSLAGWVGRTVWLETGRIEEAARRLGMRSLDLTAELIGFDWRAEQGAR